MRIDPAKHGWLEEPETRAVMQALGHARFVGGAVRNAMLGAPVVDRARSGVILTADGWIDCYRLLPTAPHPIDCEMGNWFVATHPKSMLGRNLLVARALDDGRLRLFNHRLSTFRPESAAPVEQTLQTRAEFAEVFADGFGLDVVPADLDAVMAALDRLPPS